MTGAAAMTMCRTGGGGAGAVQAASPPTITARIARVTYRTCNVANACASVIGLDDRATPATGVPTAAVNTA